jgi:hypothetical protein
MLWCIACGTLPETDHRGRTAFEAARVGNTSETPTGTFAIAACREPCEPGDERRSYVVGELVLFDDPELAARLAIQKTGQIIPMRPGDEGRSWHNGCFEIRRTQKVTESYLGIDRRNVLMWERDTSTGVVTFSMFSDSHAGYSVEAVIRGEMLVGVGVSWGFGVAEISGPDDFIVGRRIGPPDTAMCRKLERR